MAEFVVLIIRTTGTAVGKVRKLILIDVSYWKHDTNWRGGVILTSTIKLYSTLIINMSKK
jgi:hypothetical protein